MKSRTINLTRIAEGNHYNNILKRKFDYDIEIRNKVAIKQEFLSQRLQAKRLYDERSTELISYVIKGVEDFVRGALGLADTNLFDRRGIFGEILNLNMHVSDHELTLSMVEKAVRRLASNVHVVRMKSHLARKRNINDLIEPARQCRRLFLIIEQAECLNRKLTVALVGALISRLSDETSPTDTIMVLFCRSLSAKALPLESIHCLGMMKGIGGNAYKVNEENMQMSMSKNMNMLLRSQDLKVKLAPEILDFIYEHVINVDATITNMMYLHCYSLFEHYYKLDNGLKKSVFQKLDAKHQSLCDDMSCLAIFVYEEGLWPCDVSDIYSELTDIDDLSRSQKFFDALQRIRKIDHSRLVKRFENVANEFDQSKKQGVISIFLSYKQKIENNKECQDLVSQLIDEIMKYAQNISIRFDDHQYFYFNDLNSLKSGCFTASRQDAKYFKTYLDNSSYFGVLMNKILHSTAFISASELCDEVLDDFKRLMNMNRSENERDTSAVSPVKRSRRRTTIRATEKSTGKEHKSEERDGLARAIFVDLIDSMEHQGIAKLEARAKGKVIKRLVWPALRSCAL